MSGNICFPSQGALFDYLKKHPSTKKLLDERINATVAEYFEWKKTGDIGVGISIVLMCLPKEVITNQRKLECKAGLPHEELIKWQQNLQNALEDFSNDWEFIDIELPKDKMERLSFR